MLTHLLLFLTVCLARPGLSCAVAATKSAHVVFMIGEDEYKTWITLPEFAQTELEPRGYRVTIVHADKDAKNDFPTLIESLRQADVLFVSVRRRTPIKQQLEAVRAHLTAGRPLVGIRTTSHAFALRPKSKAPEPQFEVWQEFDAEVLGGNYTGHHGATEKTMITVTEQAAKHPILTEVSAAQLIGHGSLYTVSPLKNGTTPLLVGVVPGHPAEPVAWTYSYGPKQAPIFYTSLGHTEDFKNLQFRRLLVNSIDWALRK
jgi:type 1 glutamine amidotransferase